MELAKESATFEASGVGMRVIEYAKFQAATTPGSLREKRANEMERLMKKMTKEKERP